MYYHLECILMKNGKDNEDWPYFSIYHISNWLDFKINKKWLGLKLQNSYCQTFGGTHSFWCYWPSFPTVSCFFRVSNVVDAPLKMILIITLEYQVMVSNLKSCEKTYRQELWKLPITFYDCKRDLTQHPIIWEHILMIALQNNWPYPWMQMNFELVLFSFQLDLE